MDGAGVCAATASTNAVSESATELAPLLLHQLHVPLRLCTGESSATVRKGGASWTCASPSAEPWWGKDASIDGQRSREASAIGRARSIQSNGIRVVRKEGTTFFQTQQKKEDFKERTKLKKKKEETYNSFRFCDYLVY
ncbi:hypothetical protein STCU_10256 [Strigomonas culicis]|uniref:Uncharacterized protein n=1 Tax=Strigomonas culicis TaxID=28005 RepID=S9TNQ0_9TRYP|nr:hypothetical protein STCU_10256 [Strigomonas culicis]|eukprot:EPY18013.1 hypothetical protein STCU_10256 [Strigomonas culicis]